MAGVDALLANIFKDLRGPFFIVGSGKNSGKTTFLNRASRVLHDAGRAVGITTIGHDGEAFDAILGHAKPPVEARPGQLFCLTEEMAARAGGVLAIERTTDFETAVGRLVLARCAHAGRVEILGPETNAKCHAVCRRLGDLGADVVLVDGAFHRRTQIALADQTPLTLVISGDLSFDLDAIESSARYAADVFALPRAEPPFTAWPDALGAFDAGDAVGVRGPLTDAIATDLMKRAPGKTIFIEDATKIFCDEPVYRKLVGACGGIFVARSFDLRLLAANPTARGRAGFDPPSFAAALKRAAPLLPVIDVVAEIAL